MSKVIAAINMTLDGYCDHTSVDADEELHWHYAELLRDADALLYGRITYQLMEFWPPLVKNPSGNASMDGFAMIMDKVPKIVFSRTLKELHWDSATLATRDFEEEVMALKQQPDKTIYLGSPSLIVAGTNLRLVDEYQICIHPVIAGTGLLLFKNIQEATELKLKKTKIFNSGAVVHYYEPKE
jgi:dihydrofolate reductase